jgi:hypothetical protein
VNLLLLADMHGRMPEPDKFGHDAGAFDLVLLLGDITNFGDDRSMGRILDGLAGRSVLGVAGNCDGPAAERRLSIPGPGATGSGPRSNSCLTLNRVWPCTRRRAVTSVQGSGGRSVRPWISRSVGTDHGVRFRVLEGNSLPSLLEPDPRHLWSQTTVRELFYAPWR